MANNIINLDALRAESQKVLFLGKEFEIGYIPSGLAIPLIEHYNKIVSVQKESDGEDKLFKDTIKCLCIFCKFYHEEFSEEYICGNASLDQIQALYFALVNSIRINFAKENIETDDGSEKKTIPIGLK